MPSFQDSAVIFFLALLLFGPKKLPELARQLGKLMAEFRRASNEFRMQMEDELRLSEQEERKKKIAAMEAAAPVAPAITNTIAAPITEASAQSAPDHIQDPLDRHPHTAKPDRYTGPDLSQPLADLPAPMPIATSGDLNLMPPATGLPIARSANTAESSVFEPVFDSIPQVAEQNRALNEAAHAAATDEAMTHG